MPVDVLLLYTRSGERGTELLVGLRRGGFVAGEWDSPSGKLEPGEPAEAGMAREAFEETGLRLQPDELQLAAATHWHPPDGTPRIGLFFHRTAHPDRHGQPTVREPEKCPQLQWAPLDDLPQPVLRYTEIGVELFRTGRRYTGPLARGLAVAAAVTVPVSWALIAADRDCPVWGCWRARKRHCRSWSSSASGRCWCGTGAALRRPGCSCSGSSRR
ncbi:NUDIX domain-containing protein [Dactylosporangium sp. McL0621]|uniref:NUDIX domain-containing protein n=1 Tax=Dactylosporangium sp. McL0621 TaxID=3415678 RepID=UPI003CE8F173